ncbi:hypothetical protein [Bradyrhizobium canariense]|uniref:Chemotaxis protein CheZ n=1 Tax=Bradyrhizobium canariense TaxID=255045 RepID=A0A1H1MB14_9BRAD|nr:hypothetical protein [Bradyrhizobium canariense]SDR84024.1 hypothetical protein SAMN05444158_0165 [Bradyrhizobium canariense]
MANEAFALSPISARATQPSEEDYDAISEAFMETARGRWFLGEYAKRNRNADTRMVLDAVARIEQSIVAQKQQDADNRLADALATIKATLDDARAVASAALDNFALEENLAPVHKGVRVIKEISWRWREIGADGRICDLIDSQIAAIEASCERISSSEPGTALSAAFDLIDSSLAAFDGRDSAPAEAATDIAPPPSSVSSPMTSDEMPAAAMEQAPAATGHTEVAESAQAAPAGAAAEAIVETVEVVETAAVTAETIDAPAAMADTAVEVVTSEVADMAADAHDEAVLDMIAMEMAAPDASDLDAEAPLPEMHRADPPLPEPEVAVSVPEPPAAMAVVPVMPPSPAPPPLQPSLDSAADRLAKPSYDSSPEPADEPSLGSTLVASGILRKPISASDPLAPIRRLSQAEKIALFS